jgi:hypothetical protein
MTEKELKELEEFAKENGYNDAQLYVITKYYLHTHFLLQ